MKFKSLKPGKKFTYHCFDEEGNPRAVDAIVVEGPRSPQDTEPYVWAIGSDRPDVPFEVLPEECAGAPCSLTDCWVAPARKTNRMTADGPATATQHVWTIEGSKCQVVWDADVVPEETEFGKFFGRKADMWGEWVIKRTLRDIGASDGLR